MPPQLNVPLDPATGKPITEFIDGIPVDPKTGRQMVAAPSQAPSGVTVSALAQIRGCAQREAAPPAPAQAVVISGVKVESHGRRVALSAEDNLVLDAHGVPPATVLPAIPAEPPIATTKCITENCNCKPKDHGMCARCLRDTIAYMKKDSSVTWEFLETNGLALPSSSARSEGRFLTGLKAKLTALNLDSSSN